MNTTHFLGTILPIDNCSHATPDHQSHYRLMVLFKILRDRMMRLN